MQLPVTLEMLCTVLIPKQSSKSKILVKPLSLEEYSEINSNNSCSDPNVMELNNPGFNISLKRQVPAKRKGNYYTCQPQLQLGTIFIYNVVTRCPADIRDVVLH